MTSPNPVGCSRRDFLHDSLSCAGHLALASLVMPAIWKNAWARQVQGPVVATEPFGRLEKVADGVWALISTPLNGDRTTLANGGLIAGKKGVLAIEGFYQPQGAAWLAGKSRELTGRWPTQVLVTHYHADHANGVAGYLTPDQRPAILATGTTRDLVLQRNLPADAERTSALNASSSPDTAKESHIDLGGRVARVIPLSGHTPSDLAVVLDDPAVTFCGDLFWNAMFPNYVDAMPTTLKKAARGLRRPGKVTYVPGHGAVATDADLGRYLEMIDVVEDGARRAHAAGTSAADAAKAFTLPASLGEWAVFGPTFFERAFSAWYKELGG